MNWTYKRKYILLLFQGKMYKNRELNHDRLRKERVSVEIKHLNAKHPNFYKSKREIKSKHVVHLNHAHFSPHLPAKRKQTSIQSLNPHASRKSLRNPRAHLIMDPNLRRNTNITPRLKNTNDITSPKLKITNLFSFPQRHTLFSRQNN